MVPGPTTSSHLACLCNRMAHHPTFRILGGVRGEVLLRKVAVATNQLYVL